MEGSKSNFDNLLKNVAKQRRPHLTAYHGAVCAPPHTHIKWLDVPGKSAVGGDVGVMDISYKAQWHLQEGDALSMRVPCKPMEYYLKEFAHVDFFSLDVEGDVRS